MTKAIADKIVVLITIPSKEEAENLGSYLVESKLAACANIISGISSIFFWEGKCCHEQEVLMIIKTKKSVFKPLCEAVLKRHPYKVPEIIALPIVEGLPDYLQWIETNTQIPS